MNNPLPTPTSALARLHEVLGTCAMPLLVAAALLVLLVIVFTWRCAEPPAPTLPLPPAKPMPTILVADDSALARARLIRLFHGAGFETVAAKDGVEAMRALADDSFAVLVTDLEMPNMNGFELIDRVRGTLQTRHLPIIAITGHDELQARVHDVSGLYGIFKKRWNDRELLERVDNLVRLVRAGERSAALTV